MLSTTSGTGIIAVPAAAAVAARIASMDSN